MAKNDTFEDLDGGSGKKGGKMMTAIFAVVIVLIWIAIFALLIKLDVGGFGSTVLYPVLKNVPVLNLILPVPSLLVQSLFLMRRQVCIQLTMRAE